MFGCAGQNLHKDLDKETVLSCPEPDSCTFEVFPDKMIVSTTDGVGKIYYKLQDNPGTKVIKYKFDKKVDAMLADAGYSEEVVFQINNDVTTPDFTGTEIQNTNMLFGVMCFCKDKAGFYKVESGELKYDKNTLKIMLPDIVQGQRLKEINIEFKQ